MTWYDHASPQPPGSQEQCRVSSPRLASPPHRGRSAWRLNPHPAPALPLPAGARWHPASTSASSPLPLSVGPLFADSPRG
eukprot:8157744-Heterocapsa_arctica.AAC.1